jgi:hypothetical protein
MNQEQKELLTSIQYLIDKNQKGFYGVYGSGGTGKTYTITQLNDLESFLFLAPTNKSAKIVTENIKKSGVLKKCITIDRHLGYKKEKDENNKDLIKYTPFEDIKKFKVIIIDEVSMMSDNHLNIIKKISKESFVICIGDVMQLPPVKGNNYDDNGFECSPIFNEIKISKSLTIQNRQSIDSKLFKMISDFRSRMIERIDFREYIKKHINNDDILFMDYNSKEFSNYVRNNKVTAICYKNMTSDFFSFKIGKIRTGLTSFKQVQTGGVYYFLQSCITNEKTFYTSEVVKILSIENVNKEISIPIIGEKKVYEYRQLTVQCEDTKEVSLIYLPNPKATKSIYYLVKKNLSHLNGQDRAKLNTWYSKYLTSFARLNPTISMTAHKSQGSTFENIIVPIYDFADYQNNYKYFNQLFYVAISRASKNILFVDGKSNFSNKSIRVDQWTEEEKKFILEINDYQCIKCDLIFESDRDFEIHHEIPLSFGGTNNEKNLKPICKSCHKIIHQKK